MLPSFCRSAAFWSSAPSLRGKCNRNSPADGPSSSDELDPPPFPPFPGDPGEGSGFPGAPGEGSDPPPGFPEATDLVPPGGVVVRRPSSHFVAVEVRAPLPKCLQKFFHRLSHSGLPGARRLVPHQDQPPRGSQWRGSLPLFSPLPSGTKCDETGQPRTTDVFLLCPPSREDWDPSSLEQEASPSSSAAPSSPPSSSVASSSDYEYVDEAGRRVALTKPTFSQGGSARPGTPKTGETIPDRISTTRHADSSADGERLGATGVLGGGGRNSTDATTHDFSVVSDAGRMYLDLGEGEISTGEALAATAASRGPRLVAVAAKGSSRFVSLKDAVVAGVRRNASPLAASGGGDADAEDEITGLRVLSLSARGGDPRHGGMHPDPFHTDLALPDPEYNGKHASSPSPSFGENADGADNTISKKSGGRGRASSSNKAPGHPVLFEATPTSVHNVYVV